MLFYLTPKLCKTHGHINQNKGRCVSLGRKQFKSYVLCFVIRFNASAKPAKKVASEIFHYVAENLSLIDH